MGHPAYFETSPRAKGPGGTYLLELSHNPSNRHPPAIGQETSGIRSVAKSSPNTEEPVLSDPDEAVGSVTSVIFESKEEI